MKKRDKSEISSKHVVLRTVVFAVAFITAVVSITLGVASIGKKYPGWQIASATPDSELPNYSSGFYTMVFMKGSSGQIRNELASFNKTYTDSLKRVYKLMDCENEYDGYVNMATINKHLGETIKVPKELYDILKDGYEKTLEGSYNLFSGPLFRAKQILENAEGYDREWEQKRLSVIEKALSDLSGFSIVFFDDYNILVSIPQSYIQMLKEYEFNSPVLDFGENTYNYKTVLMDDALTRNGYPDCIFCSI